MNDREKRVERAQMRVLFQVPFFAPAVAKLSVRFIKRAEAERIFPPGLEFTACTDGKQILWFDEWFDSLPDAVLPTVLCHEAEHCLLGHLWRMPVGGDFQTWNQAADHAVNLGLKEFGAIVQRKRVADPFPFPAPQDSYCADSRFAGMAEEAIYNQLAAQRQGGGGIPQFGEMIRPDPATAAQASNKSLQNDWEATLIQSVQLAVGRGDCPGNLERMVGTLVSPNVPWYDVLRSWVREHCADDWDWLTPALEYEGSGFILPSMRSEKVGPVVVASDWSGSTYGELAERFHAEKQYLLDTVRPSKLVDFGFDTRVVSEREYVVGDTIDPTIRGGGGTSFVEVLARCRDMVPPPKAVVVLTDMDGEFGEDPGVPCLWVTWEQGATAPFGEVIYADK